VYDTRPLLGNIFDLASFCIHWVVVLGDLGGGVREE
jgi:hypothetical protein